jgi:hypothetical protein
MNLVRDTKIGSIEEEEASLAPEVHTATEPKDEVKEEAPKAETPKAEEKKEEAPKAVEAPKAEETVDEVPVVEAPANAKKGKLVKSEGKKKEAEKKVPAPKFIAESVVDENIAKALVEAFSISNDDAKAIIAKVKETLNQQIASGEPTVVKGYNQYTPIIWNGLKFIRSMAEDNKVPFRMIPAGTYWLAPSWQTKAEEIVADTEKTVYQIFHGSKEEGYECNKLQIRKFDEKGKPYYEDVTDEETKKKIFGLFAEFQARNG